MSLLITLLLITLFLIFGRFILGIIGLFFNKNYMYECGINQIIRYSPTTKAKIRPFISDLVDRVVKYSKENYAYSTNQFNDEVDLIKSVALRCVMYVAPDEIKNIPQSPILGKIISALKEEQSEGNILTKAEAVEFVKNFSV